MTPLAAYLLLFVAVGTGFIFVHLVAGKLIRPSKPHSEKATIYECGEPTIGSAWIQFDLRFYVVALLFVIFDVEVAFFFPWAEVFGKANAIANAPLDPDAPSAAEYNDLGEKILDLAVQSDSPAAVGNQLRWKKMHTITDEEVKAYQSFTPAQTTLFRSMQTKQFDALKVLTPQQRGQIKRSNDALRATFAGQAKARESAMQPFLEAAKKRPGGPGNVPELIQAEHRNDQQFFEITKLSDFAAGKAPLMLFVRPPVPGAPTQPRALYTAALALDPRALKAATAMADAQVLELKTQAGGILDSLQKMGPQQSALWGALSPSFMKEIDSLTDEEAVTLTKLSREGVMTLYDKTAQVAKEDARTIAWLALGEILVFFGVLLVGFAYLWKRGDLAWVRATVAEQGQYPLAPVPTILPVTRPLETASAGEHAGS
jgi:NADH:ubiquinone oxidoreductase subunit 3 (subunit A)